LSHVSHITRRGRCLRRRRSSVEFVVNEESEFVIAEVVIVVVVEDVGVSARRRGAGKSERGGAELWCKMGGRRKIGRQSRIQG
jgi:hypothetical protein